METRRISRNWGGCENDADDESYVMNDLALQALATFGMGPHSCLGAPLYLQEAKVLLAMIARSYDVSNATGAPNDWGVSPNAAGGSPAADVFLKFVPHKYV